MAHILYLHGFASGPSSEKGVAVDRHFSALGHTVVRLNLRVPDFEHMLCSEMVRVTGDAIPNEPAKTILFGSSLGGLTAARVAASDTRPIGLILLAPAFGFVPRWRMRLGASAIEDWRATGYIDVDDYALKKRAKLHYGFLLDAERLEQTNASPNVSIPTLIVHGKADDIVPIDGSRAWAANKPNVRLVEVDDNHALTASLPLILREAEQFIGQL